MRGRERKARGLIENVCAKKEGRSEESAKKEKMREKEEERPG